MSRIPLLMAAAVAAAGALAPAAPPPGRAPTDEEKLIERLHRLDEQEMDLGRLAQQRGDSRLTRRFGVRLERDHDELDARLLRRADARGLLVEEDSAPPEERLRARQLRTLRGPDFDRAFADAVDEDQARAAALLHAERSLTGDRRTRKDVDAALSVVDEHRKLAEYLQRRT